MNEDKTPEPPQPAPLPPVGKREKFLSVFIVLLWVLVGGPILIIGLLAGLCLNRML